MEQKADSVPKEESKEDEKARLEGDKPDVPKENEAPDCFGNNKAMGLQDHFKRFR